MAQRQAYSRNSVYYQLDRRPGPQTGRRAMALSRTGPDPGRLKQMKNGSDVTPFSLGNSRSHRLAPSLDVDVSCIQHCGEPSPRTALQRQFNLHDGNRQILLSDAQRQSWRGFGIWRGMGQRRRRWRRRRGTMSRSSTGPGPRYLRGLSNLEGSHPKFLLLLNNNRKQISELRGGGRSRGSRGPGLVYSRREQEAAGGLAICKGVSSQN